MGLDVLRVGQVALSLQGWDGAWAWAGSWASQNVERVLLSCNAMLSWHFGRKMGESLGPAPADSGCSASCVPRALPTCRPWCPVRGLRRCCPTDHFSSASPWAELLFFFKYRTTVCTLGCHPELLLWKRGDTACGRASPLRGHVRPCPLPSCQAGGCSSAASGTRSCFCFGMF